MFMEVYEMIKMASKKKILQQEGALQHVLPIGLQDPKFHLKSAILGIIAKCLGKEWNHITNL